MDDLMRRYRDPGDDFQLVIVRGMWLTGFDCPSMHTLYIDKPMHVRNLMQAIARVNRIFLNKPAGLVVDTIGIATDLNEALAFYSDRDRGNTGINTDEAVLALKKKARKRFLDAVAELERAFKLLSGRDEAAAVSVEVEFSALSRSP